jgi:hypothetical protein
MIMYGLYFIHITFRNLSGLSMKKSGKEVLSDGLTNDNTEMDPADPLPRGASGMPKSPVTTRTTCVQRVVHHTCTIYQL